MLAPQMGVGERIFVGYLVRYVGGHCRFFAGYVGHIVREEMVRGFVRVC